MGFEYPEAPHRYQKVVQWLLNHMNKEIFEMQQSLLRLSKVFPLTPDRTTQWRPCRMTESPKDLPELLHEVNFIESGVKQLAVSLAPAPTGTVLEEQEDREDLQHYTAETAGDSFEKFFAKSVELIDISLSTTEQLIQVINEEKACLILEPPPSTDVHMTPAERQVRFVDKAKRIRSNLSLLEEDLLNKETQSLSSEPPKVYSPPTWSTAPSQMYYLEQRKNEEGNALMDRLPLNEQGHYLFGRLRICDVVLNHATCSRQHAILQFRPGDPDPITGERTDEAYIYDLGSTSGTFVNEVPLEPFSYYPVIREDILHFGEMEYHFVLRDGLESNLTPPQADPAYIALQEEKRMEVKKQDSILPPLMSQTTGGAHKIKKGKGRPLSEVPEQPGTPLLVPSASSSQELTPQGDEKSEYSATETREDGLSEDHPAHEATKKSPRSTLKAKKKRRLKTAAEAFQQPSPRVREDSPEPSEQISLKPKKTPLNIEFAKVNSVQDLRAMQFDEIAYKEQMRQAYAKQQEENERALRESRLGNSSIQVSETSEQTKESGSTVSRTKSPQKKEKKRRWWRR